MTGTIVLFLLAGCSTFNRASYQVQSHILNGNYEKAIEVVKPLAETPGDDQLIYLLDYGLLLQLKGDYRESNKVFLKAEATSEIKDYTSISRSAGAIIFNEGMIQYKGDDYEKVLINVYLAINFLMLKEYDSALVEARKINEKLTRYRDEAKKDYGQNGFARVLSAMLWEQDRKWDDAYIDYKFAYEADPNIRGIEKYLVESARRAQRMSEYRKWKKLFPHIQMDSDWGFGKSGELVIIFQSGRGPVKRPNPNFRRIPELVPRENLIDNAKVTVENLKTAKSIVGETGVVFDLESTAINSLKSHYAGLIAKRVAGMVAKKKIAGRVAKENEVLGLLTFVGLHLSDQTDLRQWMTLPQNFQLYRAKLAPGKYRIKVEAQGASESQSRVFEEVEVKKGRKAFLNWRAL